MQKIIPHLWFDKEAKEAAAFYVSLFENSSITHSSVITGTPSGDCDIVSFTLAGSDFMAISAGPYFKINPSISFYVRCDNEAEIEKLWKILSQDGSILMPFDTYPWATKYAWVSDRYGVSWQLSLSDLNNKDGQKITPFLMFTQNKAGKAKEAMEFYTSIFPHSFIDTIVPYAAGDEDKEGYVKHARFTLCKQQFMALESTLNHQFTFNEGISLLVNCESQEEIDEYWNKLSHVPESEQCGWLKDKYGVSWQIHPNILNDMLASSDKAAVDRVIQAFLQMKKFDIEKLKEAFEGK